MTSQRDSSPQPCHGNMRFTTGPFSFTTVLKTRCASWGSASIQIHITCVSPVHPYRMPTVFFACVHAILAADTFLGPAHPPPLPATVQRCDRRAIALRNVHRCPSGRCLYSPRRTGVRTSRNPGHHRRNQPFGRLWWLGNHVGITSPSCSADVILGPRALYLARRDTI